MYISQEALYKEMEQKAKNKTLVDVNAKVSYHYVEAYMQCPLNVFRKNCLYSFAEAVGEVDNLKAKQGDARPLAINSRDALGKALMAGVKYGRAQDAIDEYRRLIFTTRTYDDLTVQEKIQVAEFERELCNRVGVVLSLVRSYFKADSYDAEVSFEWAAAHTNITLTGQADLITHSKFGDFIVEIKNTGNPGWIVAKSCQVAYYEKIAKATGHNITGGFYLLLPPWYDNDGKNIFAIAADAQIREGNKDLTEFWKALRNLITTPLNIENFPGHPGIAKCKTCAQRNSKLCTAGNILCNN